MDMIFKQLEEISKAEQSQSSDVYNYLKENNYVVPLISRNILASLTKIDAVNTTSLRFKSDLIHDYYWDDEEKVGPLIKEILDNLFDKNGKKLDPLTFFSQSQRKIAVFEQPQIELIKDDNGKIISLYNLNPKNNLISKDRKTIKQFCLKNINNTKKAPVWSIFGKENGDKFKKSDNEIAILGEANSERDDYYPEPDWISGIPHISLKDIILTLRNNWYEEADYFESFLIAIGVNRKTAKSLIEQMKDPELRDGTGKFRLLHMDTEGENQAEIKLTDIPIKDKPKTDDDYDSSSNQIAIAHNVNQDILGVSFKGNRSTTTQSKGALNIYKELAVINQIKRLAGDFNQLFKEIDPNHKAKLNFKTFEIIDEKEQSEVKDKEASAYKKQVETIRDYVELGSLLLFNEYRTSIGQEEIKEEEWNKIISFIAKTKKED